MIFYHLFSLITIIYGTIMLGFIYKNYPKSRTRSIIFGVILILTITSSLAIIFEKFNISITLFGITECIYTYKYNKKECCRAFDPYLLEGYIIGFGLILMGIIKGSTNGFFW